MVIIAGLAAVNAFALTGSLSFPGRPSVAASSPLPWPHHICDDVLE